MRTCGCCLLFQAALVCPACFNIHTYYPAPTVNKSSSEIQAVSAQFEGFFDNLIKTGHSDDPGDISPNTTSFSIVLFSGSDHSVDEDPVFFEYSHTAPILAQANTSVGLDTVFPTGTLTQLFTVYAWLIELGDGRWNEPISAFLPQLAAANVSSGAFSVDWNEVTIGSLAGQMSGIVRDSHACRLGHACNYQAFAGNLTGTTPYFLPDTTPILSNAAFQLLAFALEQSLGSDFASILSAGVFQPLNMTQTSFLSPSSEAAVFARDLRSSDVGEPASLGLLSTPRDLARAGRAMLSSQLASQATTRRWLQPVADTSNLFNGVGRPWEIYHAGRYANSSILDVYTKTGLVGAYASYFGLAPDLGTGFAILAHDTSGTAPDLNVYADVVSLAVAELEALAAGQATARYNGTFSDRDGGDVAVFQTASDGPGLVVSRLAVGGIDLRNQTATAAGIALENLDFRVYPSNIARGASHLFVAVVQDKSAPVDADTPTCITWQEVGSLGPGIADRFVFEVDAVSGQATSVTVLGKNGTLAWTTASA
ncbi:Beta-lactamase/transpeptidase-like protein [Niveomyces insectorum RCEF 264]|uniref:Beta-lactamase/transpeptidase-like protein n=1 Tax=Niveomyces insectorum RCEF 264 TaxID=1081102 RepID=A0A168AC64_9HYPO|nr:Beta-lactamase/transpeptidase-like protein [Niveomyces insectorum RCEF 264]